MAYGDPFKKGDRVRLNYPDDINVHNREGTIVKGHGERMYYVQLDNKIGILAVDEQLSFLNNEPVPTVDTFSAGDYDID